MLIAPALLTTDALLVVHQVTKDQYQNALACPSHLALIASWEKSWQDTIKKVQLLPTKMQKLTTNSPQKVYWRKNYLKRLKNTPRRQQTKKL